MIKAVIFDVDGVLVDSGAANVAFYRKLLVRAGYPEPSDKQVNSVFHLPLVGAVQELIGKGPLEEAEMDRIWELVRLPDSYDLSLLKLPPKLKEVLDELHIAYRLAVVTSRIKSGTDDVLDQ